MIYYYTGLYRLFLAILHYTEQCGIIFDNDDTGLYRLLDFTGQYRVIPDKSGLYWTIMDYT